MDCKEAVINFRFSDTELEVRCCIFLLTQSIYISPKYGMSSMHSGIQIEEDAMSGLVARMGKMRKI
jgi:hypothetical protein